MYAIGEIPLLRAVAFYILNDLSISIRNMPNLAMSSLSHDDFVESSGKQEFKAINVLNQAKFRDIAGRVLRSSGFKMRDNSATLLSNAVQHIVRNILDSAIIHNRRKRWFVCIIYYLKRRD